jgi:FlaA1/EpsC-like NDP-sugar epimerase
MPACLERPGYRRPVMLAIDGGLIALAYWGAFALRFDGQVPRSELAMLWTSLPWAVAIQMAMYFRFHLNQTVWRYVSVGDVVKIGAAAAIATIVFAFANGPYFNNSGFPRSIYALEPLLQVSLVGGCRMLRRVAHDLKGAERGKRILIFGAGDAGEMIVRDMKRKSYYGYKPVGFIDDDRAKLGLRIHGVPVLGSRSELARIITSNPTDEILIAMPRVPSTTIREVVKALEPYPLPVKILPSLPDVINGAVTVSSIRNIALEDLLARPPIGLDGGEVRKLIESRRVLVTGAGGSIGSELCRQIIALRPEKLVMFERHENSLYSLEKEFCDRGVSNALVAVVGDVCDRRRVDETLSAYAIQIIFHAAAHKHVPLMEENPCEAIKNNVRGTRILVEAAVRSGVERFVLVSTDKAVNPCNVMGASKRVAEMLVEVAAKRTGMRLAAVRFGNVLGSNGSVIPRFLEQIKKGGPVTVTHPEIRRFFMLIPEAVQLTLHATAIAEAGAIYVLEMGDQIRIVDMARHLIRLSGLVPDEDIKIEFSGLRSGEKLFEELVSECETVASSAVSHIRLVRASKTLDDAIVAESVRALESAAFMGDRAGVVRLIKLIVPTFQSAAASADNAGPEEAAEPEKPPDYPLLRRVVPAVCNVPFSMEDSQPLTTAIPVSSK